MKDKIVLAAANMAFGQPVVTNHFRGHLVEAIVAEALKPKWAWVSRDWASWDFETEDGLRLEVKQSAALQSWHKTPPAKAKLRFDICERTGYYVGVEWHLQAGRFADIYIFAAHQNLDVSTADHRDPDQWAFYVVATQSLPRQKSIGLSAIQSLAKPVGFGGLLDAVQAIASSVRR